MSCKDCKETLYPEDPEAAPLCRGKRFPPLCETCSYLGTIAYQLEHMAVIQSEFICDPLGCPAWQRIQSLQGEVTHIHKVHHERRAKKYKEYV